MSSSNSTTHTMPESSIDNPAYGEGWDCCTLRPAKVLEFGEGGAWIVCASCAGMAGVGNTIHELPQGWTPPRNDRPDTAHVQQMAEEVADAITWSYTLNGVSDEYLRGVAAALRWAATGRIGEPLAEIMRAVDEENA